MGNPLHHYLASVCGVRKRFLPVDYLRLQEHFHSLKSWAMYEHVAHRKSLSRTSRKRSGTASACPISTSQVSNLQATARPVLPGDLQAAAGENRERQPHSTRTRRRSHVKKVGKGYVWVFTNMEEVVYMYRKSREGDFLHDLLKDFRGVLVSDFYAAYDSLACEQQKCLIHLIRDFNTRRRGPTPGTRNSSPWPRASGRCCGRSSPPSTSTA